MTKKSILGLDLGTNSIGWALVEEARDENNKIVEGSIIKLGVRVNPLTVDEKINFEKGKPISTNADRTLKRGARRNLQRYKLRRADLIQTLIDHAIIDPNTPLTETGSGNTHTTLKLRARASRERVELEELARIFLAINKKRGYKSSRKAPSEDEGLAIDGMAVAKHLYDHNLTPGQYALQVINEERRYVPDFYPSDLQDEFNRIWHHQQIYYSDLLTVDLYQRLQDKNKSQTWAICQQKFDIEGIKLEGNKDQQRKMRYKLRDHGLKERLDLEHLAIVLQEINADKNKTSGYLGAISDRSKVLYIDQKTVGQYLWEQIRQNPHTSLKNQVFYRQDYLDEFELIWETQRPFHPELTPALKDIIRDTIIFYQRKLKSQKGLLSFCQFESWEIDKKDKEGNAIINKSTGLPKKQTVGHRVIPKSSPLFQQFKIWQNINDLIYKNKHTKEVINLSEADQEVRQTVFKELNLRGDLSSKEVLKILDRHYTLGKIGDWTCKFKTIQGNRTNKALYDAYQLIVEREGYGHNWAKKSADDIQEELHAIFTELGIDPRVLSFSTDLQGDQFDKQYSYQLWHLLYSAEDDGKTSEEDRLVYGTSDINLKKSLHRKFGFKPEYSKLLAGIRLQDDYGNLSARAIRKIMPFMKDGNGYSEACAMAGYNHSHSLTKEQQAERTLKDRLELLPKNSLRNPVVEKILNQMVNVVNQICDTYGKPDEVRIELARELKKSAAEREEMTKGITAATKRNDDIRSLIFKDFGFHATRNDVIRYKLWEELSTNGHKSIFTGEYIPREKLFSKEIDIEHIIPKALLFDDSFSNKTLAYRQVNLEKGSRTAMDFITETRHDELDAYIARVEDLYNNGKGAISRGKYKKLLMTAATLPDGFIERDLRNSQFIAKKAKSMLFDVFKTVIATSGSITDRLRKDWDLINVMKELNLPKYRALGLTEIQTRWDNGQEKKRDIEVIKDWTKRNDHRHHAMDALTVAFTTHNHIQYINYLNARINDHHKEHGNIIAIEKVITEVVEHGRNKR